MKKIKLVWDWLVRSSENAQKISLMVKGVLLGIVPTLLLVFHTFNIQLTSEVLTSVVNDISVGIIVIGGIISSVQMVFGLFRKIITTVTGTNDVIASYQRYGGVGKL